MVFIEDRGGGHHAIERELVGDGPPGAAAERARERWIGQQPIDGGSHGRGVRGWNQQPGVTVAERLPRTAHVGCHDRRAGCHRFEKHVRQRFIQRRHH
jgi:hypothetical protein